MTQSPPTGELVALICERVGQDFDNEAHFSGEEAGRIADAITTLERELERERALSERLKLEAQCHAMEARTANSTIYEIYQVLSGGRGEPGNWNGAEPARQYVTASQAEVERLKALVTDMTRSARKLELAEEERNRAEAAAEQPRLMDAGTRYWAAKQLVYSVAFRARAALQVEESKG